MIVPQFWAEARIQTESAAVRSPETIGWSDASPKMPRPWPTPPVKHSTGSQAVNRLPDANRRCLYNAPKGTHSRRGDQSPRRDGVTELLRALCLNSPNVLFHRRRFRFATGRLILLCNYRLGLLIAGSMPGPRFTSSRYHPGRPGPRSNRPIVHIVHGLVAKLAGSGENRIRAGSSASSSGPDGICDFTEPRRVSHPGDAPDVRPSGSGSHGLFLMRSRPTRYVRMCRISGAFEPASAQAVADRNRPQSSRARYVPVNRAIAGARVDRRLR